MKKIALSFISVMICIAGYSQLKLKAKDIPSSPCTTPMGKIMFAPVDTAGRRGVADNYKIWNNGSVLKVKFLNGSESMRQKVMTYQKEWEQYANIKLNYVSDYEPETDIRIRFGSAFDSLGHNSYIGLDNKNPQYAFQQTMNLDTSDFFDYDYYVKDFYAKGPFYKYLINKGVNLNAYTDEQFVGDVINYPAQKVYVEKTIRRKSQHEFGHALGLLHEQSYPGAIHWNKDTIYKYYSKMHWSKEQTDFNVLLASAQLFTNGTSYDPNSIMHYPVYSWQTLDGFSVEGSTQISEGDKKLIAALYPKNKLKSDLDVHIVVSNFSNLTVTRDNKRKAVVIRPVFDLKSGAALANLYYLARLVSEDGKYYIPSNNIFFSWNGMAAVYLKANILANSSVSYNKGLLNKLELLFPYDHMPELNGKKFKVEFTVYQNNATGDKMYRMATYTTSTSVSMSQY